MPVRLHPKKGFYVDGLTVVPVQSFREIEDHMEKARAHAGLTGRAHATAPLLQQT